MLDGVQFLQRPYFLDPTCYAWRVVGARGFASIEHQLVFRTERFQVPDDAGDLDAVYHAAVAEAASRGLTAVWLVQDQDDGLTQLVYFIDRVDPPDPTTPDFATLEALAGAPALGDAVAPASWTRIFDRTQWTFTDWFPYVYADRGRPSLWPYSPPFPEPTCGDGVLRAQPRGDRRELPRRLPPALRRRHLPARGGRDRRQLPERLPPLIRATLDVAGRPRGSLMLTSSPADDLVAAVVAAAEAIHLRDLSAEALPRLQRAVGASNALLYRYGEGGVLEGVAGSLSELSGYTPELVALDPLQHLPRGMPPGVKVVQATHQVETRAYRRSDAYHLFYRPHDVEHVVCTWITGDHRYAEPGMSGILLARAAGQDPFSAREARALEQALPAFAAAARRSARVEASEGRRAALEAVAAGTVTRPVLALGPSGRVLWMSPAAAALLGPAGELPPALAEEARRLAALAAGQRPARPPAFAGALRAAGRGRGARGDRARAHRGGGVDCERGARRGADGARAGDLGSRAGLRADAGRGGGAGRPREGAHEPRDRRQALRVGGDGAHARGEDPPQDGRRHEDPGGAARARAGGSIRKYPGRSAA